MKDKEILILVFVVLVIAVIMMKKPDTKPSGGGGKKPPPGLGPGDSEAEKRKQFIENLQNMDAGTYIYGTLTNPIKAEDATTEISGDVRVTVEANKLYITEYNVTFVGGGMTDDEYSGPYDADEVFNLLSDVDTREYHTTP